MLRALPTRSQSARTAPHGEGARAAPISEAAKWRGGQRLGYTELTRWSRNTRALPSWHLAPLEGLQGLRDNPQDSAHPMEMSALPAFSPWVCLCRELEAPSGAGPRQRQDWHTASCPVAHGSRHPALDGSSGRDGGSPGLQGWAGRGGAFIPLRPAGTGAPSPACGSLSLPMFHPGTLSPGLASELRGHGLAFRKCWAAWMRLPAARMRSWSK